MSERGSGFWCSFKFDLGYGPCMYNYIISTSPFHSEVNQKITVQTSNYIMNLKLYQEVDVDVEMCIKRSVKMTKSLIVPRIELGTISESDNGYNRNQN